MSGMEQKLGEYLRSARQAAGFTLRKVEEISEGRVKNGYLSQVESGVIRVPSTHVLHELAKVYKVDYDLVLRYAGLPTQNTATADAGASARIGAIPMTALEDLDEAETKELLDFVAFIRSKRPS